MDITEDFYLEGTNAEWYAYAKIHAPDITIEQFILFIKFMELNTECAGDQDKLKEKLKEWPEIDDETRRNISLLRDAMQNFDDEVKPFKDVGFKIKNGKLLNGHMIIGNME